METENRLIKLREERLAREKARLDKLRALNLKKYGEPKNAAVNETKLVKSTVLVDKRAITAPLRKASSVSTLPKPTVAKNLPAPKTGVNRPPLTKIFEKKPLSPPIIPAKKDIKPNVPIKNYTKFPSNPIKNDPKLSFNSAKNDHQLSNIPVKNVSKMTGIPAKNNTMLSRKSFAPISKAQPLVARKSMLPKYETTTKSDVSVFERLYQPKISAKRPVDDATKLRSDPNYLKIAIKNSGLIAGRNKRHTCFEPKKTEHPVRRSISAVHFKRIDKSEMSNCIHKWASIGEKLNKVHLKHINEDDAVREDKLVSAVKSERKRVTFLNQSRTNFNTPKPEELQAKLKSWLQKRGKSLDSYHHLQCFGLHHIPREIKPLVVYDDEDKENMPVDSDSDDGSYTENMNEEKEEFAKTNTDFEHWRTASCVSLSVDFNETTDSTVTTVASADTLNNVDEVLLGALNDLTELLKEGYDWEQCARWLRSVRERCPAASQLAAYWECRAALEERRGDLPASVHCWEEALAKGTQHSVVEASLDQLLDKFMQLKISPNGGRRQPDPKMLDVKNVFKSTIIRFAVQKAKLRQSSQSETPKYTVTPVRRSGRLSCAPNARTPLTICSSIRQAPGALFVPNDNIAQTP